MLTNDVVSFEQPGPVCSNSSKVYTVCHATCIFRTYYGFVMANFHFWKNCNNYFSCSNSYGSLLIRKGKADQKHRLIRVQSDCRFDKVPFPMDVSHKNFHMQNEQPKVSSRQCRSKSACSKRSSLIWLYTFCQFLPYKPGCVLHLKRQN